MRRALRTVGLLIALLALLPAPVIHAASTTYTWNTTFGGYVDDRCGTSEKRFKIVLRSGYNLTGDKLRLCAIEMNLADAPRYQFSPVSDWANITSSLNVYDLPDGWITLWVDPNKESVGYCTQVDVYVFFAYDNDFESVAKTLC